MYLRFWKVGYYENTWQMFIHVLAAVLVIYITCVILEKIRQLLFRYTIFDKLIEITGNGIDKLFSILTKDKAITSPASNDNNLNNK